MAMCTGKKSSSLGHSPESIHPDSGHGSGPGHEGSQGIRTTALLQAENQRKEEEGRQKAYMLPTKHNSKQPDYGLIPDWRR